MYIVHLLLIVKLLLSSSKFFPHRIYFTQSILMPDNHGIFFPVGVKIFDYEFTIGNSHTILINIWINPVYLNQILFLTGQAWFVGPNFRKSAMICLMRPCLTLWGLVSYNDILFHIMRPGLIEARPHTKSSGLTERGLASQKEARSHRMRPGHR